MNLKKYQKLEYILTVGRLFLENNSLTPYSEEEVMAFFHQLLLLKGPVPKYWSRVDYKANMRAWILEAGAYISLAEEDREVLYQLELMALIL